MTTVFLSYAAQDRTMAQRVADGLARAGMQVWKDDDGLKVGDTWLDVIGKAAQEATHGLFLLSPASVRSAWAKREYQYMLEQRKPVVVACVGDVDDDDVPYQLRALQRVNLTENFDQNLNRLIHALEDTAVTDQPQSAPRETDLKVTLEVDEDTDTQRVVDLINRLSEIGVRDIKVVNGGKR